MTLEEKIRMLIVELEGREADYREQAETSSTFLAYELSSIADEVEHAVSKLRALVEH